MARTLVKLVSLVIIAACCFLPSHAADPSPAATPKPTNKASSTWVFSLLPKAFQKHPLLAISIITEMTDEGRKLKPPTPENPTYYYVFPSGYHEEGGAAAESKISEENLKKQVQTALAPSGYLPSTKEHPATLVLFLIWGVHSKLPAYDPETGDGGFDDVGHHNLLSRAALVGGAAFAKDLSKALSEQSMTGQAGSFLDPVYRFTNRDDLTRNLMEQVLDDCYYVVISAYDGAAVAHGERKLLWRTKISTPAQGVSLVETAPALVAGGESFFGRDMTGPAIIDKRISRVGKVETGQLKVIGIDEKSAEQKTPPATK